VRFERGDPRGAAAAFRELLALRPGALPDAHPVVAASLVTLGRALHALGDPAQAERMLREAVRLRHAHLPPGHWASANAESVLGELLLDTGRDREAGPLLVRSHDALRASRGDADPRTVEARERVARWRARQGA
jgi:ATP/maltotriose-dependent transcriptional regulator MalT